MPKVKVKLKRREAIEFASGLTAKGLPQGSKFSYAIAINARSLRKEVESVSEAGQSPEECQDYLKARDDLLEKHAERDENNKPVRIRLPNGKTGFDLGENRRVFEDAEKALKEEHAEAVAALERHEAEFKELLEEHIEIFVHQIDEEIIPETATPDQLVPLWPMLKT